MAPPDQSPCAARTSSFSGGNGNCISVRFTDQGVEVGDTKHPETPPMRYTPDEWVAFVLGVHNGEFEPPAEWIAAYWATHPTQLT